RYYIHPFACQVNFIQHHPEETLTLGLNYTVDVYNGTPSMHGRVKSDPGKNTNRKIFVQVERKENVNYMRSVRNIKYPDDEVSDSWLKKYEPLFFIYPNESIDVRIKKQQNDNYLFMLETLPTNVCHPSKTDD
ncbi:hypothetical protein DD600_26245, partial [Enterobacter cloacae]|uniref:hypothetical protein n=1 Tax=Enterobacter cloacae TaxID=550 RepID=UPI0010121EA7